MTQNDSKRPQLTSNDSKKPRSTSKTKSKSDLKGGSKHHNIEINEHYLDKILHNNDS